MAELYGALVHPTGSERTSWASDPETRKVILSTDRALMVSAFGEDAVTEWPGTIDLMGWLERGKGLERVVL